MSSACSKHVNYQSPRNSYYCAYQPHASTSSSKLSAGETDPSNSNPSDSESVIDRIKRRSFYCRFNEKKPKRASTIVGPAARDYYREMASKQPATNVSTKSQSTAPNTTISERGDSCSRSKSATPINSKDSESGTSYKHSSYLNSIGNSHSLLPTYHHRHYHSTPVSQSNSSKLRHENDDSDYKPLSSSSRLASKANDYLSLRNTLTSPTSTATRNKSYSTVPSLSSDYLLNGAAARSSNRSSLYEHTGGASTTSPFLYASASYNPKRRTSSYIAPSSSSSSSLIGNNAGSSGHPTIPDHSIGRSSYSTLTQSRKPRAYDHRSVSMLDSNAITSCGLLADRRNAVEPHQLGWWTNH